MKVCTGHGYDESIGPVEKLFFVQKCDYFPIHHLIDMFRDLKELSPRVVFFEYPQHVSVEY